MFDSLGSIHGGAPSGVLGVPQTAVCQQRGGECRTIDAVSEGYVTFLIPRRM